jgi:hypothetical protein
MCDCDRIHLQRSRGMFYRFTIQVCVSRSLTMLRLWPVRLLMPIRRIYKTDKAITALGVMVFVGPYAEIVEFLRCTRYAVLSGLAVKNYYPYDEDHIGYFEKNTIRKFLPEKVHFEWLNSKDVSPVLLLWLNETAFAFKPLKEARDLVELIEKETKNAASHIKADSPKLNFKFIGPAGSTTLQAMQFI